MDTPFTIKKNSSSLSAKGVLNVFFDLYESFLSKKISVDEFSDKSNLLWQQAESRTGTQSDILWSELADILSTAGELSWYSRSATKNYPWLLGQIQSFINAHKKIGKNTKQHI